MWEKKGGGGHLPIFVFICFEMHNPHTDTVELLIFVRIYQFFSNSMFHLPLDNSFQGIIQKKQKENILHRRDVLYENFSFSSPTRNLAQKLLSFKKHHSACFTLSNKSMSPADTVLQPQVRKTKLKNGKLIFSLKMKR